ncbi:MAG: restriction endonuclease [Desulfovibrionales bacterium]|nr:restriction endonuclease [Desulfovibrionales bacterium]
MTVTTRLDHVCDIIMGQAPSGEAYNSDQEGWPLIAGAGDFGEQYPAAKKFTTEASKLSQRGDIILGIRATIGEKVLSDGTYCLGRGVAGLRAHPNLAPNYLWHWLSHIRPFLASKAKGATFKQVNRQDIGELEIQLPPLADQRRIAEILDRAEALRAKRRAALAQLDTLTQAIFLALFGDPTMNSRKWPMHPFGEICESRLGKMLDQKQQTGKNLRPYLRNANVQWFQFDLTNIFEMDFDASDREEFRLKEGDLLICEGGEPGRAAIWREQLSECYYQKALHRARPKKDLANPEYLAWLLFFLADMGGLGDHVTSATIAHLTGEKLKVMRIPLPPLPLQHEFARRVAAVEKLKAAHRASVAEMDALFTSLQHRAFRGEL